MARAYATGSPVVSARDALECADGLGKEGRRTNVPALRDDDADDEEDENAAGAEPSVEDKGCGLIQEGLELLRISTVSSIKSVSRGGR